MIQKKKAVFFDKDGTLVKDIPYNSDPDLIELDDGVASALEQLQAAEFLLVIVSNQAGVARGYFKEESLAPVENKMRKLFQRVKAVLAGFYYCPHHPEGSVAAYAVDCVCRKPKPGLIERAARDLHIDLGQSWMVGDILNDVEAGNRAGCRTILVDNGNETEWLHSAIREPDARVDTVLEASKVILNTPAMEPRESIRMKDGLRDE